MVVEYIAKSGGVALRQRIHESHILQGGVMEYNNILESLEAQGKIMVEALEGKWRPHSKVTLVNTEG